MRTLFCSWVDLNYKGREELLQIKRRGERKMFRHLKKFILAVLAYDPTVELWNGPATAVVGGNPSSRGSSARFLKSGTAASMDVAMA